MGSRCILLTTDTLHHRFMAHHLAALMPTTVMVETKSFPYRKMYRRHLRAAKTPWALLDNPYLHIPHPWFDRAQDRFEQETFPRGTTASFPSNVEEMRFPSANDPACVAAIQAAEPTLIVSFGTGVLKENVLRQDCLKVNVHRGIVPAYRGLDSDLWACYRKDFGSIGTTIHQLTEGLDLGPVHGQQLVSITKGTRAFHLRYHTTMAAAQILTALIESDLTLPAEPQDPEAGTYYSFIPPIKRRVAILRLESYERRLAA